MGFSPWYPGFESRCSRKLFLELVVKHIAKSWLVSDGTQNQNKKNISHELLMCIQIARTRAECEHTLLLQIFESATF